MPYEETPLTNQQQKFLASYAVPATAIEMLHAPLIVKIEGAVNIQCLEKSLQSMVNRHSALRTCFCWRAGQWRQRTVDKIPIELQLLAFTAQEAQLLKAGFAAIEEPFIPLSTYNQHPGMQLLDDRWREPMAIGRAPLWQTHYVAIDAEFSLLLINIHFLISDGISAKIIFADLCADYQRFFEEESAPIAPIERRQDSPFHQFCRWENDPQNIDSWQAIKHRIQSDIAHISQTLPTAARRDRRQQLRDSYIDIPAAIVEKLLSVSQQLEMTLFNIFLAAYQLLIHQVLNTQQLLVWVPLARRTKPQQLASIGCFMQKIFVVTHYDVGVDKQTFLRLAKQVWQQRQQDSGIYPFFHTAADNYLTTQHLDIAFNFLQNFKLTKKVGDDHRPCTLTQVASKHNKESGDIALLIWELNKRYRVFFSVDNGLLSDHKIELKDLQCRYIGLLQHFSS